MRRQDPDLAVRIGTSTLRRANRILRRAPDAGIAGLRRIVTEVSAIKPRPRDWLVGVGLAEVNWLADLACLVACCGAVGAHQSSLLLVALAYVAGKTATSLTFLPGGLGVTDAAMIFTLTQGGVSTGSAAAAVLLYRLISFALVVALGWLIWAIAWIADQHRAIDSTTPMDRADAAPDTSSHASTPAALAERAPEGSPPDRRRPNAQLPRSGSTRCAAARPVRSCGVPDAGSVDRVRDGGRRDRARNCLAGGCAVQEDGRRRVMDGGLARRRCTRSTG
jgi:hypothetical protein